VFKESKATISPPGTRNGRIGVPFSFDVTTVIPSGTSYTEYDSFSADSRSVIGNYAEGVGKPPATVTLTFTKAGSYTVYLDVSTDAGDSFVSTTVNIT
jgi:PKD repeat protein